MAYASASAHESIRKALDCCGLGSDTLRLVPVNPRHQMNLAALKQMIDSDRRAGFTPFLVAGTAGTVDIGAIDDLDGIAVIAHEERLWFHVDGAFGALGILAPEIAPRLAGIEAADSLAFDFHKWGQVPYDAGFVLLRDGELHRKAFASPAAYLERETARFGRRFAVAVRLRPGSFARIPGLENLVHSEGLRTACARRNDHANL